MAVFTVIAGPNGSGKSSLTRQLDFEGRVNLLDPDAIARQMTPDDPSRSALSAGREVIRRSRSYIEAGENFAVETTFSGGWILTTIEAAIDKGFFIRLVYVCLNTPERNIQRVRERVAQGGHSVPDEDIRRRYSRSLENVATILEKVNQASLYDNSEEALRKVLEMRKGAITWQDSNLPLWASGLIADLS